jgi:hypothetical protein
LDQADLAVASVCADIGRGFWGYPPLALGHEDRTNNLDDIKQTQTSGGQIVRMSLCKSAMEIAMDQHQIDWQAVHVLAKLAALRAIKRQIQKEGRLRVSIIPACKSAELPI